MTTPTTASPGIHQLPEPCWTVLTASGEGAGYEGAEYHHLTRAAAEADRDNYTDPDTGENTTKVEQCKTRCWTATLLCGEGFVYAGDSDERHFIDRANLLHCADLMGSVLIEDGDVLTCGDDTDCDTCGPRRRQVKQELSIRGTHPDVLGRGVAEGWADPVIDPTEIDWKERNAHSLMGTFPVDGRPVNPWGPHLKYGRGELGHWGEKDNADAVVFAICDDRRYLLLGERDDGHGWAFPGGGRDPGETALDNAVRELREETGLVIDPVKRAHQITVHTTRYVRDPRATREAWMVTTPVTIDLGKVVQLPTVAGADDLLRAEWFPCDTVEQVHDRIAELGGKVFASHEQMLTNAILGALS